MSLYKLKKTVRRGKFEDLITVLIPEKKKLKVYYLLELVEDKFLDFTESRWKRLLIYEIADIPSVYNTPY